MRLIDADALIEKLKKCKFEHEDMNEKINNIGNDILHKAIPHIVKYEPTAFNKEKVINGMKDSQRYYEEIGDNAFTLGKVAGIYECIQIVKNGGIDGN